MKIAVPTKNNEVDDHFGHCEAYTLFTIGGNKHILNTEKLMAPKGCGCKSNIASILQKESVQVMLAGNMGNGALNVLNRHSIKVYRGCKGNVETLVNNYLEGKIVDSGLSCVAHGDDHECNHNHQ